MVVLIMINLVIKSPNDNAARELLTVEGSLLETASLTAVVRQVGQHFPHHNLRICMCKDTVYNTVRYAL
jgi:hypothetical protein